MKSLTLREGLIQTQIGADLLIYDTKNETFYAFNETASKIVNGLQYCVPQKDFIELIGGYFSTDSTTSILQVKTKVTDFLDRLLAENLLKEADSSSSSFSNTMLSNVEFKNPHFNKYKKDWLKLNHPGAFYSVTFGDTWGPGSDHPHP
ncbi:hypothetical protein [Flavobacterium sp. WC2429]|jgi:hypothetical protein|uniref:PqqD family protein n=1 Tax=Flavobacterium sp. WC2429 TaxID=3234140 RepID=A0AB39WJ11_9FLAO